MNTFGLIGRNIDYSFSRNYFKTKFEKEGINASYVNFDLPDKQALESLLRTSQTKGFNVTIPYKEEILPLLDLLDKATAKIGAVNTVKREGNGMLKGYNTDYIGFRDSLLEYFEFSLLRQQYDEELSQMRLEHPHKALILGTGGASKAVHYALETLGVDCTFISRKRTSTATSAAIAYSDITELMLQDHTFIINCTPLGTHPATHEKPAIPYEFLNADHVAYDLIYNPEETSFLKLAKEQGAQTINGLRMLELQAEASWAIWNTEKPELP